MLPNFGRATKAMLVQIPVGTCAGQEIDVPTPEGHMMRIMVPTGSKPGDVLNMHYVPQDPQAGYREKDYRSKDAGGMRKIAYSNSKPRSTNSGGTPRNRARSPSPRHRSQPSSPRHADNESGGVRRALLIGCNYRGQIGELSGCVNDTANLRQLLMHTYGWNSKNITILHDEHAHYRPTRDHIIQSCKNLVAGAKKGDYFFFHFSGHGGQQIDPFGYEEDGMNETLFPCDFKSQGMISDDVLNEILIKPLPNGAKMTCILDACHSGTGLDLPYTWTHFGWKEDVNPFHTSGDVIMLSGCADEDVSADGEFHGKSGGAMTLSLCTVLKEQPHATFAELIPLLHRVLRRRGFRQRPMLSSSQQFKFTRRFDVCGEIRRNSNERLGRTFVKKFKPDPDIRVKKFMADIGMSKWTNVAAVGVGLLQFANQVFGEDRP